MITCLTSFFSVCFMSDLLHLFDVVFSRVYLHALNHKAYIPCTSWQLSLGRVGSSFLSLSL